MLLQILLLQMPNFTAFGWVGRGASWQYGEYTSCMQYLLHTRCILYYTTLYTSICNNINCCIQVYDWI